MHIVRVTGLWVHPMLVYVGDHVYWSVILCLAILCGTGIFFAVEIPLSEEVRWVFGCLFGTLFLVAGHNQGFFWNLWTEVEYVSTNSHTVVRMEEPPPRENILVGLFMYGDRLIAMTLFILGCVYFSDLGGGPLQIVILLTALCFYIGSWAAYLDPPAMHQGRCYLLQSNARWYALMTNLWHLTLTILLLSLIL